MFLCSWTAFQIGLFSLSPDCCTSVRVSTLIRTGVGSASVVPNSEFPLRSFWNIAAIKETTVKLREKRLTFA